MASNDVMTYEDEQLMEREKNMKRKLLRKQLDAFDANEAELQQQLAKAQNVGNEGMLLNGMRMYDPAGKPMLNDNELAAKQLAASPQQQLQLLGAGEAALPGRPHVQGFSADTSSEAYKDILQEKLKKKALETGQAEGEAEYYKRQRLLQLLQNA